jgi:CHASE2 domain-containing sensor protein
MVQALREAGARAAVFKYFLDQAKDGPGDRLLAESFKGFDVFLQARIDDSEKRPNELDERWSIAIGKAPKRTLSGTSGWLPLPALARGARGIGFVDIRNARTAPMYERYKGKIYPSLVLSVMRYLLPDLSLQGDALRRGDRSVPLNEYGEAPVVYPARDDLRCLSYVDVIRKRVPAADLSGKIVVVGYEGPAVDMLDTPIGKISAHRVFCYFLASLYGQLTGR